RFRDSCCRTGTTRAKPIAPSRQAHRWVGMQMGGVDPVHGLGFFDGGDVEVDSDRFVVASDQHTLKAFATTCVDLLVRNEWRDVDEIAGTGLGDELEPFSPAHPGPAFHDINHALEVTVMVCSGFGVWLDRDG